MIYLVRENAHGHEYLNALLRYGFYVVSDGAIFHDTLNRYHGLVIVGNGLKQVCNGLKRYAETNPVIIFDPCYKGDDYNVTITWVSDCDCFTEYDNAPPLCIEYQTGCCTTLYKLNY